MYDPRFYDTAAERIPATVFSPLRDRPRPIEDDPPAFRALEVPAIVVRFTPGDSTLYEILVARGMREAMVAVVNMRLVFGVPWDDTAYVDPHYLAGQVRGRGANECTMLAVAAVVNRAIDVCHNAEPHGHIYEAVKAVSEDSSRAIRALREGMR
jgi:hypothetical protein